MKNKTLFSISILFSVLVLLSATSTATAQVYGGRAIGATASINNNGTVTNYVFADTGPLPSGGGSATATAPSSSITGVMGTGVLTASTSGALRSSQSITVANDVLITVGGATITANRVTSNSGCICCPNEDLPSCSGSTNVSQLTITDSAGTRTVTANGEPNQVVPFQGGTLTINQQITGLASITVNGLRVTSGGHDIIIASSQSSLDCLVTFPTAGEVTVSGRVVTSSGTGISKATVKLTDSAGNVRTTSTNTFGSFSFADVPSGSTYVLHATHRMYQFDPVPISVNSDMSVDLVAKN